jgi:hypothetical protein
MDASSIMSMVGSMQGGAKSAPQYQAPQQSSELQRLQEIARENQMRGLQAPAVQMAQQAPGYSFQYRNPSAQGAAPGQQYGVMAQDLERTPAGRSVVMPQPDGTKMVDTGRLSMQNTAAIGELGNEIEKLKQHGQR